MPISQYHLGVHNLGDGASGVSIVKKGSVDQLEPFEQSCIKAFISNDLKALRPLFAPNISKALGDPELEKINKEIHNNYGFSGQYERLQIVQALMASDEAAFKDAFEYYDFVRADYLLKGSTNAVVRLFMTKLEGNLKLAGFVVMDYEANPKGNHEIVKFIYPESEDKARLRGRYMRKVN